LPIFCIGRLVFNITPELFHIIDRGRRGRDRM